MTASSASKAIPASADSQDVARAIRAAVARAMASPSPGGDLRAVAVGGAVCVIRWSPRPARQGGAPLFDVVLRFRRGEQSREHSLVVSDLATLATACEHHLRFFVQALAPALDAAERQDAGALTRLLGSGRR